MVSRRPRFSRAIRVPRRSGGNCRVKTLVDRLVEAVVCGGGGALLGFCLAILILSQLRGLLWFRSLSVR